MQKAEMVRTIASLSSGTQSRLLGTVNYKELEERVAAWINWVNEQPEDSFWDSWQLCFAEYRLHNVEINAALKKAAERFKNRK